jgi:hypothetical protein
MSLSGHARLGVGPTETQSAHHHCERSLQVSSNLKLMSHGAAEHDRLYGVAFLDALANVNRDQIAG